MMQSLFLAACSIYLVKADCSEDWNKLNRWISESRGLEVKKRTIDKVIAILFGLYFIALFYILFYMVGGMEFNLGWKCFLKNIFRW